MNVPLGRLINITIDTPNNVTFDVNDITHFEAAFYSDSAVRASSIFGLVAAGVLTIWLGAQFILMILFHRNKLLQQRRLGYFVLFNLLVQAWIFPFSLSSTYEPCFVDYFVLLPLHFTLLILLTLHRIRHLILMTVQRFMAWIISREQKRLLGDGGDNSSIAETAAGSSKPEQRQPQNQHRFLVFIINFLKFFGESWIGSLLVFASTFLLFVVPYYVGIGYSVGSMTLNICAILSNQKLQMASPVILFAKYCATLLFVSVMLHTGIIDIFFNLKFIVQCKCKKLLDSDPLLIRLETSLFVVLEILFVIGIVAAQAIIGAVALERDPKLKSLPRPGYELFALFVVVYIYLFLASFCYSGIYVIAAVVRSVKEKRAMAWLARAREASDTEMTEVTATVATEQLTTKDPVEKEPVSARDRKGSKWAFGQQHKPTRDLTNADTLVLYLMDHKNSLSEHFRHYCEVEYSLENFLAFEALEAAARYRSNEREYEQHVQSIWSNFVMQRSPCQINLPSATVKQFEACIKSNKDVENSLESCMAAYDAALQRVRTETKANLFDTANRFVMQDVFKKHAKKNKLRVHLGSGAAVQTTQKLFIPSAYPTKWTIVDSTSYHL